MSKSKTGVVILHTVEEPLHKTKDVEESITARAFRIEDIVQVRPQTAPWVPSARAFLFIGDSKTYWITETMEEAVALVNGVAQKEVEVLERIASTLGLILQSLTKEQQ